MVSRSRTVCRSQISTACYFFFFCFTLPATRFFKEAMSVDSFSPLAPLDVDPRCWSSLDPVRVVCGSP